MFDITDTFNILIRCVQPHQDLNQHVNVFICSSPSQHTQIHQNSSCHLRQLGDLSRISEHHSAVINLHLHHTGWTHRSAGLCSTSSCWNRPGPLWRINEVLHALTQPEDKRLGWRSLKEKPASDGRGASNGTRTQSSQAPNICITQVLLVHTRVQRRDISIPEATCCTHNKADNIHTCCNSDVYVVCTRMFFHCNSSSRLLCSQSSSSEGFCSSVQHWSYNELFHSGAAYNVAAAPLGVEAGLFTGGNVVSTLHPSAMLNM